MPSTNKTTNILLNQYQGNEYQKRTDVNEDNLKIDNKFGLVNEQLSDLTNLGFRAKAQPSAATDLNNIKNTSICTITNTMLNYPSSIITNSTALLQTISYYNDLYTRQIAYSIHDNKSIAFRTQSNGVWSDWEQSTTNVLVTTDANNLTTTGRSYFNATCANTPFSASGTYGIIDVIAINTVLIKQRLSYIRGNGTYIGRVFERYCDNGTWSTWKEIADGTDTGWINLTLLNGVTAVSGAIPQYRKIGNRVFFRGQVTNITTNDTNIATLPIGFRAIITTNAWICAMSGTGISKFYNSLTGNLNFSATSVTQSASNYYDLSGISYFID